MTYLTNHPLPVAIITFAAMWLASKAGAWLRDRRGLSGEERNSEFEIILAATLTLLALIIGFSVSMAASRYDRRVTLEEEEANAIGTEYVRADMLPAPDAARVHALLGDYLQLRILFFTSDDDSGLEDINRRTSHMQSQLWVAVRTPAQKTPAPITAVLVVGGMNDVLNSQGYTQAAFWDRIPIEAWGLMAVVGLCSNMMIGYGAQYTRAGKELALVLPFILATAFLLIADIDAPRHGMTHVIPRNLITLAHTLGR
jgi:hypothetical protein